MGKENDDKTAKYDLVRDGNPRGVIIQPNESLCKEALDELLKGIERASGAVLPLIDSAEMTAVTEQIVRIFFIPDTELAQIGIEGGLLEPEEYRIVSKGNQLIFTGSTPESFLYAVSSYLDQYLGVRWLWPGDVGTYVPKRLSIELPDIDERDRPALEIRRLRSSRSTPEVTRWNGVHRMGNRSVYKFGHAFGEWWAKYGKEHPEYFAHPPEGQHQVQEERIKLDLSVEAIDDVIIREWTEAGQPNNWNISPNDGVGFCVSPGCLAMDDPPGQNAIDVWRGDGKLTGRYVKFWNRLLRKMRAINPKLMLSAYAYSSYREPPAAGVNLHEGMLLGIVHSWQAYEPWEGWFKAGAQLFLRPNWWHYGAIAPHLLPHATGNYFKFAQANGMKGFDFDSIMGNWGTQGLNYYLIARLSVRPELSVDEVIDEYTSAFGKAQAVIKQYFAYWEAFSEDAAYNVVARKAIPGRGEGKFEILVKEHDLPSSPTGAGWFILPYLLTDDVLNQAREILDRASQLLEVEETEEQARITFLRDGLRHVEMAREVIRYGYEKTRPKGATLEGFIRLREQLDELRTELDAKHVIWADFISLQEQRRGVPTHESRTKGWEPHTPSGPSSAELNELARGLI